MPIAHAHTYPDPNSYAHRAFNSYGDRHGNAYTHADGYGASQPDSPRDCHTYSVCASDGDRG